MKDETKIIKVLKSGNFTIIYWDNQSPTLYKGKWDMEKEYKRDDYETMNKSLVCELDDWSQSGYCPKIVHLLAKALDGKADSI